MKGQNTFKIGLKTKAVLLYREIKIFNKKWPKATEEKIILDKKKWFAFTIQIREAAKNFFVLVDSPLRGGRGGNVLSIMEKRTVFSLFFTFFQFVGVEKSNIFCLKQHIQILMLVY